MYETYARLAAVVFSVSTDLNRATIATILSKRLMALVAMSKIVGYVFDSLNQGPRMTGSPPAGMAIQAKDKPGTQLELANSMLSCELLTGFGGRGACQTVGMEKREWHHSPKKASCCLGSAMALSPSQP
jgi:hypothetical protein